MARKRRHSPLEDGLKKAARYLWTENAVALTVVGGCMIAMSWIRTRYPWAEARAHVAAFVVIFSRVVEKLASHALREGLGHPSETEPDQRAGTPPKAPATPAAGKAKSRGTQNSKGRSQARGGKPKRKKKGNRKGRARKAGP